jgi:hypothetical protein
MDDFLKDARYVVVFTGDESICFVIQGFDATLEKIRDEIQGEEEGEPWEGFTDTLSDPEEWCKDDFGPWSYQTDFGDGGRLRIFRVHEERS